MRRKCSHCGNNGHNSRTCNGGKECFKLFGVKIVAKDHHQESEEAMKKSFSMGNLMMSADASSSPYMNSHIHGEGDDHHRQYSHGDGGYLSDSLTHSRSRRTSCDRKKGVPWSEEEHRTFLIGLKKLGRGDWRGISKNFVPSRSPTQVASHAQKYFLRQTTVEKKKRRASVFDLPLQDQNDKVPSSDNPSVLPSSNAAEAIAEAKSTAQHLKIRPRTSYDDILPSKKFVLPLKLRIDGKNYGDAKNGIFAGALHSKSILCCPKLLSVMVVPKSQPEMSPQVGRPSSSMDIMCDLGIALPILPPDPEASEPNDASIQVT